MFALIAFKIKVLIILKMIQRFNYQLAKQNLTGFWDKNYTYYSTDVDVKICLHAQIVTRPFEKRASGSLYWKLSEIVLRVTSCERTTKHFSQKYWV